MTGKEALRILSECANGEKKLLFSDSLDLEQIVSKELDELKEELEIANDNLKTKQWFNDNQFNLLMKYKSAFELCTRLIHIDNNIEFGGDAYWIGDIERVSYITKEQYELLEELMGNENTK